MLADGGGGDQQGVRVRVRVGCELFEFGFVLRVRRLRALNGRSVRFFAAAPIVPPVMFPKGKMKPTKASCIVAIKFRVRV